LLTRLFPARSRRARSNRLIEHSPSNFFYGVLRNLTLLDFWIGALRRAHLDVNPRDLLHLGLYQLFIAKTAEHAAVHEIVETTPKRQRAIVNAILRSAARDRQGLQRKANSESLDVRASHPKFLIERWERQFGTDAAEALCHWNNRPPPIYARINQLKINRQTFLERYSQRENAAECFGFCRTPVTRRRARSGRFLCSGPKHIARLRIVAGEAGRKDSGRLRSSRWQDWAHR
jgi:hypothetical protein